VPGISFSLNQMLLTPTRTAIGSVRPIT
jgi:hypothetical protein